MRVTVLDYLTSHKDVHRLEDVEIFMPGYRVDAPLHRTRNVHDRAMVVLKLPRLAKGRCHHKEVLV